MLRRVFKNMFVLLSVGVMLSIFCIDIAFSQTKKTASKTGKRKSTSSARKSSSGIKKNSSKKSTVSSKRAATGGSKVSSAGRKRAVSSSSRTSKRITLSAEATSMKEEQQTCRDAFVSCMDAQIKDMIDKYTYLYDDEAVQAYLETGEPFRCLFYDVNNTNLPQNMQVVSACRDVLNDATITSFNVAEADMNSLIKQYALYLSSVSCSASGEATLTPITNTKTGICANCPTYKTLNSFLSSNGSVNTAWKNYQALCKEKYLVNKYKDVSDLTTANAEYKNFVYENCLSRDVNDLYFSYNYYCDLRASTLKNAVGVKTSYCKLSSEEDNTTGLTGDEKVRAEIANVFGTTSSSEYYKEALSRLEAGELKMVNFTDSNLYKQKIEGLGLESLQSYDISSLLNTSTKCDSGYKYNASVSACQLYNAAEASYIDAGLSVANFVPATSSTAGSCPLDSDIYDSSSKKCVRCPTGTVWKSDFRKCQSTSKEIEKSSGLPTLTKAKEEDEKDARSIYTDLGINRDSSLFSINVVPPLGSGLVFPSSLFNKASTYCFDGKEKTIKAVSASLKETYKNFNKNKRILASCKEVYKDDLERYYLSGYWPKADVEPSSDGTYNLDTDYTELDFMSAKKACDMYEQNLISVRNNNYAKFDTQIKNYLEDALAGIIKNKIKDITTIANVGQTLQKDDGERTLNKIQSESERSLARAEAEIEAMNLEQEQLASQLEADKKYIAAQQELKNSISSNFSTPIISKCASLGKSIVSSWKNSGNTSSSSLLTALSSLNVKVNASGDIKIPSDSGYNELSPTSYPEISCFDVNGFYTSSAYDEISSSILSSISAKDLISPPEYDKDDNPTSFSGSSSLPSGIYLISVAGAGGGGGGGNAHTGDWGKCKWHGGGRGGNGELKEKLIFVMGGEEAFSYTIGAGGTKGGKGGGDGGNGGNSSFTLSTLGITISANGGQGGEGAGSSEGGDNAPNTGNGLGGKGGAEGDKASGGGCHSERGDPGANGWVKVYRYR